MGRPLYRPTRTFKKLLSRLYVHTVFSLQVYINCSVTHDVNQTRQGMICLVLQCDLLHNWEQMLHNLAVIVMINTSAYAWLQKCYRNVLEQIISCMSHQCA